MATSWHEKGGWRMWRTLAAAFSIFLINMQNPGWSLGMFMHSLFSPVLVDSLGNCGSSSIEYRFESSGLRDNQTWIQIMVCL